MPLGIARFLGLSKSPPQEFRARRREINSDRFSRGVYVRKTLCTERASSCTPKAYSEAQSGVKTHSKKWRSHFFDTQQNRAMPFGIARFLYS